MTAIIAEITAIAKELPIWARDLIIEGPEAIAWLLGKDEETNR